MVLLSWAHPGGAAAPHPLSQAGPDDSVIRDGCPQEPRPPRGPARHRDRDPLGRHRPGLDRHRVRRGDAAGRRGHHHRGGLPIRGAGRGVRGPFRHPDPVRRLRLARRRSRRRRGLRRHAPLASRGGHHRLPPGREARPVREAVRAQRRAGGPDGGGGTEPGAVPHGGDLEPLPPGLPGAGRRHRRGSHRRAPPRGGRLRIPAAGGPRAPAFRARARWRCPARPGDLPRAAVHARPGPDRACGGRRGGRRDRRRRGGRRRPAPPGGEAWGWSRRPCGSA